MRQGDICHGNAEIAYEVGYALAKAEHEQIGWPAFDDRMQYPRRFEENDNSAASQLAGAAEL